MADNANYHNISKILGISLINSWTETLIHGPPKSGILVIHVVSYLGGLQASSLRIRKLPATAGLQLPSLHYPTLLRWVR